MRMLIGATVLARSCDGHRNWPGLVFAAMSRAQRQGKGGHQQWRSAGGLSGRFCSTSGKADQGGAGYASCMPSLFIACHPLLPIGCAVFRGVPVRVLTGLLHQACLRRLAKETNPGRPEPMSHTEAGTGMAVGGPISPSMTSFPQLMAQWNATAVFSRVVPVRSMLKLAVEPLTTLQVTAAPLVASPALVSTVTSWPLQ